MCIILLLFVGNDIHNIVIVPSEMPFIILPQNVSFMISAFDPEERHIQTIMNISLSKLWNTVAEKDTAAAAQAAIGRSKAAVGRQRAAHRLRLAAAAQPRPPICLKNYSQAYDWLTRLLSRTHAHGVSLSVCLCIVRTRHDKHRHLGTVDYKRRSNTAKKRTRPRLDSIDTGYRG